MSRLGLVSSRAQMTENDQFIFKPVRSFQNIVQVHVPEDRAPGLIDELPTLSTRGLAVTVVDSDWSMAEVDHRDSLQLELVGQDRPGIVREISSALAELGVSVQDLRTVVESAPMSGERLFRAHAELAPPSGVDLDEIRAALERLADDMMVDVTLDVKRSDVKRSDL
jgi:glycine cleavage system regulatory protein